MQTFEVRVRSYSRREGVTNWVTIKLSATSTATAIARATRDYLRPLTRKEKRDAAKLVEVRCIKLAAVSDTVPSTT